MDTSPLIGLIKARAAECIPVVEGDYQVDGLWHCGKCNAPKQCRIKIFGKEETPMCSCLCPSPEDEEKKEYEQMARITRIARYRRECFTESEMAGWTFESADSTNQRLDSLARNYVSHFDEMLRQGKGLLLFGPVGTGKTFAAACIANALIDADRPCRMVKASNIVNKVSGMFEGRQEYIDSLNRYSLLVLDDLASERNTEYVNEVVQDIIDARYRARLPLIVTTNLSGDEIKRPAEMAKQRMFSRLLEMCFPFEVLGKDRRKEKLKSSYGDTAALLGLQSL